MKKSSIMFFIAAVLLVISAIFADNVFIKVIDFAAAVVFIVNIILTEKRNKGEQ